MPRAPTRPTLPGNRVRLLHDGEAVIPAMLAAIARAEREVLLEMYWFGSDRVGRSFADALRARASAGVRVCVTYDAVGSFEADRSMFDEMERAGCGVYEWNPVHFWRRRFTFAGINRRNHRKMLIVDNRVAYTGGVNLADLWLPDAEQPIGFRDDMIELTGPAVSAMREIFLSTYRGKHREQAIAEQTPCPAQGDCAVRVLTNERRRDRRVIERAYLYRIRMARRRIVIANSYFIPSRRIRRALFDAVRRGTDVKVLLPMESDVPAVAYATRYLYASLLRRGVQLYEFSQNILHSKTAAIDDWCTVGTHNLDYRSWAYNLEINVTIEDERVAAQLRARIDRDIESSHRVDLASWRYRPLITRLLELFFYRFRRLM